MRSASILFASAFALLFAGCDGTPKCGPGTRADGAHCIPEVVCGAGTRAEGGTCVPVATSPAVTCGTGTQLVDGKCVPQSTVVCGEGTTLENGECVGTLECPAGTQLENGACVAIPPPATWTANVKISGEGVHGSEPAIAADGEGHVWIAFTEYKELEQKLVVNLHTSSDSGDTWTKTATYTPMGSYSGRVSLAAAEDGAVFLSWVEYRPAGQNSYPADIFVVSSSDHGQNWGSPKKINIDDGSLYNDMARLAVASDGTAHLHYLTEITQYEYRTHHTVSTDDGQTWSTPELVPGPPSSQVDYFFQSTPGSSAVTASGTLLIPETITGYYSGSQTVGLLHRAAGGQFDRAIIESLFASSDIKLDGKPKVATSATGRICFAFVDAPNRDFGIFAAATDGSLDFGKPTRIDNGLGSVQTMPTLVADAEGRCHLTWMDNRSGEWEIWGATLRADGTVSANERVSDASFLEDGTYDTNLGDFMGLAVGGTTRYAAWTDTRDGASAIYFAKSPIAGP